MASVRGIGVAVITRIWGGCSFLVQSRARCSTPKRCCSSITTKPEVGELHPVLDQRVRADEDVHFARGDPFERQPGVPWPSTHPVRTATFTSMPSSMLA